MESNGKLDDLLKQIEGMVDRAIDDIPDYGHYLTESQIDLLSVRFYMLKSEINSAFEREESRLQHDLSNHLLKILNVFNESISHYRLSILKWSDLSSQCVEDILCELSEDMNDAISNTPFERAKQESKDGE